MRLGVIAIRPPATAGVKADGALPDACAGRLAL